MTKEDVLARLGDPSVELSSYEWWYTSQRLRQLSLPAKKKWKVVCFNSDGQISFMYDRNRDDPFQQYVVHEYDDPTTGIRQGMHKDALSAVCGMPNVIEQTLSGELWYYSGQQLHSRLQRPIRSRWKMVAIDSNGIVKYFVEGQRPKDQKFR
ncbi:MAG: hypothetical protein HY352_02065 [Candidatus Omnitrophica bacterium]|nr:hypothetical protein [Candidatus Omnitrophota bacterium]